MHTALSITALVLIIPGIGMAFVPFLPALSYMFVVSLVFGIYDGFIVLSSKELLVLLALVVCSILVDHTAGIVGAKYGGAHIKSLGWGVLGGILGTFIFPALGSFIGLFLGVLIAELYYKKPHDKAIKAAGGALLGTAFGVAVNVVLALIFTVAFFLFIF